MWQQIVCKFNLCSNQNNVTVVKTIQFNVLTYTRASCCVTKWVPTSLKLNCGLIVKCSTYFLYKQTLYIEWIHLSGSCMELVTLLNSWSKKTMCIITVYSLYSQTASVYVWYSEGDEFHFASDSSVHNKPWQ